jgi:hypothetical protein
VNCARNVRAIAHLARLKLRVALRAVGLKPGGVREGETLEAQVLNRTTRILRTANLQQPLRHGSNHHRLAQVFARSRYVVNRAGRFIEIPLAGFIQQVEGVFHVGGQGHGLILVLPVAVRLVAQAVAGLPHGDPGAAGFIAESGHAQPDFSPLRPLADEDAAAAERAGVNELDGGRVPPAAHGHIARHQIALRILRRLLGQNLARTSGTNRAPAIHIELSGLEARGRGLPQVLRGVGPGPTRDPASPA